MTSLQRPCSEEYAVICDSTTGRVSQAIVLSSPAKLNIFLEVLGKRPDGYHELETVMVRTQFCDQLTFQHTSSPEITLSLSDATSAEIRASMPLDESNLIVKAAFALQVANRVSTREPMGARIILHKRVPPESGLGGGSSNAATALLGCRQLWNLDVSDAQLHSIAASLGSDINFLLSGAAAAVFRAFFGTDDLSFSACSRLLPEGTCTDADPTLRSYDSFSAAAQENADSRVLIGFHFRHASEAGLVRGDKIGAYVVHRYLKPLRGRR